MNISKNVWNTYNLCYTDWLLVLIVKGNTYKYFAYLQIAWNTISQKRDGLVKKLISFDPTLTCQYYVTVTWDCLPFSQQIQHVKSNQI